MKKLYIILTVTLFTSISVFGQIKVNTSGKSFFGGGTNATSYGSININPEGAAGGLAVIGNTGNPLRIYKYGDAGYINRTGTHNGIKFYNNGRVLISATNVGSINWPGSGALNVLGAQQSAFWTRFEYSSNGGSGFVSEVDNLNSYAYVVSYNPPNITSEGTFRVKGDGTVYAKNGYLQLSDINEKTNINNISSVLDRLEALQAVSFNYNDTEEIKKAFVAGRKVETDSLALAAQIVNNGKGIKADVLQQMENEITRGRIGLIAQEVEKVVPEVVRTLPDGKKAIMYTELIPLLIEGIKELRSIVEEQQHYIDQFIPAKEVIQKDINQVQEESSISKQQVYLTQNKPNPFNQQTEINYKVPDNSTAYLGIYNLNGMQIKKYPLYDPQGTVIISGSELTPGIYIYSLIVDNQEVDSKRMVLTD